MKKSVILAALACVGVVSINSGVARASSLDMSAAGGPAGLLANGWSFGTFTTSNAATDTYDPNSFVAFTQYQVNTLGYSGLDEWSNGSTDPNVIYNSGTNDVLVPNDGSSINFQAGTVNLGPFHGPTVVQYTAPITAPVNSTYVISSTFQTVQKENLAPVASVYSNGTYLYGQQLSANPANSFFGSAYTNGSSVVLDPGQTVDFVVWGGNSDNKTTELSASVTLAGSGGGLNAVPLPGSAKIGIVMFGAIGLAVSIRRRFGRRQAIA